MIRGSIIVVVGIILTAFVLNFAANWLDARPSPADERFMVVDRYNGCSVVRYNPDHSARYSYFLDCRK